MPKYERMVFMMMHSLKATEFTVYVAGTDQELGVANIEITNTYPPNAINTPQGDAITTPVIFGEQTLNLLDVSINHAVLNDLAHGWGDLTPEQAEAAIGYTIEHRIPIRYWALKHLFNIAGWDITPYKWAPVDLKPGETMEHAYRRVALGAVAVSDMTEVVLIGPNQPLTNPDADTLF